MSGASPASPLFFATPGEFRSWLERNHDSAAELWVGLHRKGSGRPSMSWPESVDEALCFGWIDGVRRSVDATSYAIRFTPRKPASAWSRINIDKVARLEREGLMRPAGRAAFARRSEERSATYSHEQREAAQLPEEYAERLRRSRDAWSYFQARPPWYRRTAIRWVVSAKREETRLGRLRTLIECSAEGRHIPALAPRGGGSRA
jgi:uncharacterized protein YdeI (YjbR/CyaY-like superfamily)